VSSVKLRTVTHLDVEFDTEVTDTDSGEVLASHPILIRYHSDGPTGLLGEAQSVLFRPEHPPRLMTLKLRFNGELWHTETVDGPKFPSPDRDTCVLVNLEISQGQWDALLAMTNRTGGGMKRETALRHMNLCLDAAGVGMVEDPVMEVCVWIACDTEAAELIQRAAWWAQIAEALRGTEE
jgi:hypothetical protein